MTEKICTIDDCKGLQVAKGYCDNHYRLMRRNGSPFVRKKAGNGSLYEWLVNNCMTQTDKCIIWPFALKSNRYAAFYKNGRKIHAHRFACELKNGSPPSPKHHAAHKCNNRSCVNALHLRWATATENAKDKIKHGTHVFGEKAYNAKLTEEQVKVIRSLRGKVPQSKIGKLFNITQSHVKDIQLGKRWKGIINGN